MLREVFRLCKGDFSGVNKEYHVLQGDIFSPAFVVKEFKIENEAEAFADAAQKESSKHDEYTCFWVEEIKQGGKNECS